MRCGNHFGIFTSGQLQSRPRCWILKSLMLCGRLRERYIQTTCMEKLASAIATNFFKIVFKTKLVSSTLRTVVVKLLYSPTRFV